MMRFIVGAVIGAVVGVIAGIFYAPKKGIETREELIKLAREAYESGSERGGELKQTVGHTKDRVINIVRRGGKEASEKGHEAKEEIRETAQETIDEAKGL